MNGLWRGSTGGGRTSLDEAGYGWSFLVLGSLSRELLVNVVLCMFV